MQLCAVFLILQLILPWARWRARPEERWSAYLTWLGCSGSVGVSYRRPILAQNASRRAKRQSCGMS